MSQYKTKAQALHDLGRVVGEEVAIIRTLTVREAAERIWYPGGPSMEECIRRAKASGLCRPDTASTHEESRGRVFGTKAAAEYCGIATQTVRNKLVEGVFPSPHKQGRLNAWFRDELDAFLRTSLPTYDVTATSVGDGALARGVDGGEDSRSVLSGSSDVSSARRVRPSTQLDRIETMLARLVSRAGHRVYSTRTAAEYCGMPYGTFRNRIAAGTGPLQRKDGDSNGFFEADLDAWNEVRFRVVARDRSAT